MDKDHSNMLASAHLPNQTIETPRKPPPLAVHAQRMGIRVAGKRMQLRCRFVLLWLFTPTRRLHNMLFSLGSAVQGVPESLRSTARTSYVRIEHKLRLNLCPGGSMKLYNWFSASRTKDTCENFSSGASLFLLETQ